MDRPLDDRPFPSTFHPSLPPSSHHSFPLSHNQVSTADTPSPFACFLGGWGQTSKLDLPKQLFPATSGGGGGGGGALPFLLALGLLESTTVAYWFAYLKLFRVRPLSFPPPSLPRKAQADPPFPLPPARAYLSLANGTTSPAP